MFLFIAFCVSCAVAVGASLTAHHYYKENQRLNLAMAELVRAQELLARGERAVRGDANNLAQAVAEHADGLRVQAQQQQTHMNQDLGQLDRQVNVVGNVADRLDETAVELSNLSNVAEAEMVTLTAELNQVKSEMTILNAQLKSTQEALVEKERLLNETVAQLQATQISLNGTTQACSGIVNAVSSQLTEAQSLLPSNAHLVEQNVEIERLRTENSSMSKSIQRL